MTATEHQVTLPEQSRFLLDEFNNGQYTDELHRLKDNLAERRNGLLHVVDAGANVGLFGVAAQTLVGPVRLYGFEPFTDLRVMCADNWHSILHSIYPYALSDRTGRGDLYMISPTGCTIVRAEAEGWASERARPMPRTQTVDVTTLDVFGVQHVDLFKLDIEGSELAALKGAVQTLRRDKPYVICTYEHYTNDPQAIIGFMLPLGYTVFDDVGRKFLTFEPE